MRLIGRDPIQDLSLEARAQLERHMDVGEKISAALQFGLIAVLLLVWLFSPRATDSHQSFSAIPTVLMFYGPLLVLRLYWAFFKKIPETTSILFTIIDVAAITTLIFLYHLQYMKGPALSLKSPTFLFLLVVVSTRSLSFRPSLIIVATLSSMVLWGALTYFTVNHADTQLTSSFVEYSSSEKVLLGAEIEKLLALLAIGGILVVAVRLSLRVLLDAVTATEQKKSLSLFFSPDVAEKIRSGKIIFKPGHGESRLAAVLFIDLRGFTAMSETMDPSSVLKILSDYHEKVVPIIRDHNGTVDKFMGDGVLAHFGASSPSSTFAKDAMTAIDEILRTVDEWNQEREKSGLETLDVNLSAAVGPVIFGATGIENRLELTIIGQTVNVAAKLEKFNKQLSSKAIVTQKLFYQAKDQGKTDLLHSYELVSLQKIPDMNGAMDVYCVPDRQKSSLKKVS